MSEFVNSEAEESVVGASVASGGVDQGEEVVDESSEGTRRKKRKKGAVREEENGEGNDVSDLINDDPVEEVDQDNSDDEDELEDRLEDDDYDLIEENLGVKVERKKFKRLKRMDEDEDSDDDREVIANQLFQGSDNEEERPEPAREDATRHYASEESEGEYSETDDFIVDDEERPLTGGRRKRRSIFTDASLQAVQDIFRVDFDGFEEDEDEEQRTLRREKRRRRRKGKSIYEIYEPHELERAGFTDRDNRIRSRDIPERMQTRSVPVTPANDEVLDEEAEWIYKIAFSKREANKEPVKKSADNDGPLLRAAESEANWDADWDKQTTVPAPAQTVANWGEDDEWEKPSAPSRVPIARPVGTVVGDGNWDDDDDCESSVPQGRATQPQEEAEQKKRQIIPKIRKALDLMRNQQLEVPFISFYRKECVQPDLGMNDLWKIYRLDARFCQLESRKSRLAKLFSNMREYQTNLIMANPDDPIPDSERIITDQDIERIKSVKSADELRDMYVFFSLYYSDHVPAMKEELIKKRQEEKRQKNLGGASAGEQPPSDIDQEDSEGETRVRRKIGGGLYGMCKKMGIGSLVKKFGLSPDKLAENLRDNYQRHEVHQFPTDPDEAAEELCSERVKTPDEVLRAAKLMMATQISREPVLRKCVREVFFERATMSCYPTTKGQKDIDEAHPCYSMKYLKDKPVRDLTNDTFLKLSLAEKDGLLTIIIGDQIKGTQAPNYVDEVKLLFQKDEFSKNVQDWNRLRGESIEFAIEKLLFPVLRKELAAKLMEEAKDYVLHACTTKLYNWLKISAYHVSFPDEDQEEWGSSKGVRVLAIEYALDPQQASFACIVQPDGHPSDHLRLQNITKNKNAFRKSDRLDKEADLLALKKFIRSKKPHVIVVGGESREALKIQADLKEIVTELENEDDFPSLKVEILDNQLAKVYANSVKAQSDFRDYPMILRQAVSLARRMQDPLIEFSQLCNPDQEILCLRFHTLQDRVPQDELHEHLLLEFVNRANEVGVDVNRAVSVPYTSSLVQFTCGLGPRKAAALLKMIRQTGRRLENRSQLITGCGMGPKIFINCAGFIKIDTNSFEDSTESYVEVLDGSRIHPEAYEWARKMAVDALDYDDKDGNPANALEEILDSPEKLKELDLDAYADKLEHEGNGNKSITLYDIRAELFHKYKDLRVRFESPDAGELFQMLTKETPETLYVGKLVSGVVTELIYKKPEGPQLDNALPVKDEATGKWQCTFCGQNDFSELTEVWAHFDAGSCNGQAIGVRLHLDNGISGFIPIGKLSDNRVRKLEDRVRLRQTVHCRVVKIDVERFSVECTSRSSDLNDDNGEWRPKKDAYYDQEREDMDKEKKEESREKARQQQTYMKRVIVHPSFQNITYGEVEKVMEPMGQGDVVVRPSSKGPDHLTITWKVVDGIYQHIDVREEGKENKFSLGQSLWIGDDEYEDIDEIIARVVNPMASHVRDLINYKYSHPGSSRAEAEEHLMQQKASNSNKIHYLFQPSKEFPGKFLLSYLPGSKPVHEFVTATPEGFRFRQRSFDSLNKLLAWFKIHYCDPPEGHTPMSCAKAITQNQQRTPHPTTPAQAFSVFSTFASDTPLRAPYMTPYQGLHLKTQSQPRASTSAGKSAPETPKYTSLEERLNNALSSPESAVEASLGLRKVVHPSKQTGWPSASRSVASSLVAQYGGAGSVLGEPPVPSPVRSAAHVIQDGIRKGKQLSAANYLRKSRVGSAWESVASTPGTNRSPCSMEEGSEGGTPFNN